MGDWLYQRDDSDEGEIYYAIHARADYGFIANVYSSEKDAALIAAAPDLLVALQRVAELDECEAHIEDAYERLLPQIRAAIAKATNPLRS